MANFQLSLAPSRLSQTINPWSLTLGSLFTVNLGNSGDTELESRILDDVGSYGRQIGRIADALDALANHVAGLTPKEQAAIDAFRSQLTSVRRLKAQRARELKL